MAVEDGVAVLTLNRAHCLNALRWQDMDSIRNAITECGRRTDVDAIVITGSGRAFCAGLDLRSLDSSGDLSSVFACGMRDSLDPLCLAMRESTVPIVAAVNGPCVGGGLGLALLADVVVAARSAYFMAPQVTELGLVPDAGATWLLQRCIGRARALGMSVTGKPVPAETAMAWGLIWSCVDDQGLQAEALIIAKRLGMNRRSVVTTRMLTDEAPSRTLTLQLEAERLRQIDFASGPQLLRRVTDFHEKSRRKE